MLYVPRKQGRDLWPGRAWGREGKPRVLAALEAALIQDLLPSGFAGGVQVDGVGDGEARSAGSPPGRGHSAGSRPGKRTFPSLEQQYEAARLWLVFGRDQASGRGRAVTEIEPDRTVGA